VNTELNSLVNNVEINCNQKDITETKYHGTHTVMIKVQIRKRT